MKANLSTAALVVVMASCGGGTGAPASSTSPATTVPTKATSTTEPNQEPSTTTTATTTTAPPSAPVLLSLEVGPEGIEYRPGGDDLEVLGPSLLAVDPAGGLHIIDPVTRRILSFVDGTPTTISLVDLDILSVTAIDAADDHLLVVEVFFSPVRQRFHRIAYDGRLLETVDLPTGFRLEDGLSAVLTGTENQVIIELTGGARYGVWDPSSQTFDLADPLVLGDTTVRARPPDLEINGTAITADLTGGLGGMRYLGTASDGTTVVVREDVTATTPVFRVLSTVEWYGSDGAFQGSARIPPLEEQAISHPPGVAMTADGRVLALVARPAVVEVIELVRRPDRIVEIPQSM